MVIIAAQHGLQLTRSASLRAQLKPAVGRPTQAKVNVDLKAAYAARSPTCYNGHTCTLSFLLHRCEDIRNQSSNNAHHEFKRDADVTG